MVCRFSGLVVPSAFRLGFHRSESDQEAKNDGRIEVGEAFAGGGRRAAVANRQAENHIRSRAAARNCRS